MALHIDFGHSLSKDLMVSRGLSYKQQSCGKPNNEKILREQAVAHLDLPAEFSRISDFNTADFNVTNLIVQALPLIKKLVLSQENQQKLKTIYQQMFCDEIVRYKDDHQVFIVAFGLVQI